MVQQPARAVNSAIVYEAVNLVNGFRYVGFTAQGLARREWQHRQSVKYKHGCSRFKEALREFGDDKFVFKVLADFEGDEDLGLLYEEEYIAKHKPEYNLRGGGQSGGSTAESTKQKMSAVQKGRPSPLRGKPISEAHRQAIIEGKKKRDNRHSPETIAKMVANRRPYKATEETKRKASETLRRVGTRNRKVRCVDDGLEFKSCTAADEFYDYVKGYVSHKANKTARGCRNSKGRKFEFIGGGE